MEHRATSFTHLLQLVQQRGLPREACLESMYWLLAVEAALVVVAPVVAARVDTLKHRITP
jgi:hypothetical protein